MNQALTEFAAQEAGVGRPWAVSAPVAALARAWEVRATLPPPLTPAERARLEAISGENRPK